MIHFTYARLIDPESLTVEKGLIQSINAPAPKTGTIIDCKGLPLAPGTLPWKTARPVKVAM